MAMADQEHGEETDQELKPVRPSVSFETITFSDGQTLEFAQDEIVVFVGPNNAGTSAALKELQEFIARSQPQKVVQNATLTKVGTASDLIGYLERTTQKRGPSHNISYAGMGFEIHHSHVTFFDQPTDRHPIAPFFSHRLATENRITESNPAGAIALYSDPPSHPIHLLLMDQVLAGKVSGLFRRAFNKDLIVFRAGGSQFPLYVGERPPLQSGKDELDKTYVEALLSMAEPLQTQGDGMRSFATVLLYVLVAEHHSVLFLDEPEAFLHPPQARLLGEYIARERRGESQLFIATHSTDVLYGLIAGSTSKVRVIRMQREGDINRVKELSNERTLAVANDVLTRYSRVFDGIFYQRVIIAESDSDCMFYSSILKTRSVTGDREPDVLFVHAAGKHRMARLAGTLRALDVHTSVITDVDILNEESAFRGLIESLGGVWAEVEGNWRAVKTAVEQVRPPLTADQVKAMIEAELSAVGGISPFPKESDRKIRRIFASVSPWDVVKQAGRSGIRGAGAVQHFDDLLEKCSQVGLWIVPVGELEGFCRTVQATHGPAFVERVLEKRELETDAELEEVRAFMRAIWERA